MLGISNDQATKQAIYSYVQQSDVQQYWTLGAGIRARRRFVCIEQRSHVRRPSVFDRGRIGTCIGSSIGTALGLRGRPASETVELLSYGQANPPVFSKATGHEVPGPFPCFTYPTIANNLDSAGISWSYYVEGQNPGGNLNAFAAIQQIYKGPDWKNIKSPDTQIFNDISNGTLSNVSWVMPSGANSDHAGPQSGNKGPSWVASIANALGQSKYWNSSAIIVMWDDWGGWYDHVHPPQYRIRKPSARRLGVPSPTDRDLALRKGRLHLAQSTRNRQHAALHRADVRLAEICGCSKLTYADQRADAFDDMFDFTQKPLHFKSVAVKYDARYFLTHPDNTPADTY